MDKPKQHARRADILNFPHMSRKERQLLQTVLNNMSQGVLMFDSETRLIFCNKRYIELYGLAPDMVEPGCSLRDLLRHRIERGSFSGDPDEYTARLAEGIAEGKTFNNVVNLPDGRAVAESRSRLIPGTINEIARPAKAGRAFLLPQASVRKKSSPPQRKIHIVFKVAAQQRAICKAPRGYAHCRRLSTAGV
jgi:PAS domain-containing protein